MWVSLSGQGQVDIGARGGNCFSGYSSQTVKLFPCRSREHLLRTIVNSETTGILVENHTNIQLLTVYTAKHLLH